MYFEKLEKYAVRRRSLLPEALLIYFMLSVALLTLWTIKDRYPVTGDEPHYLVMASGIANHQTLEQSVPYQEEFATRKIYSPGLAGVNDIPAPENTHSIQGKNGLYNIHNIGLPLLLAFPVYLAGTLGAKLFIVMFCAFLVCQVYFLTLQETKDKLSSAATCIMLVAAMPIIPAVTQIYPDLFAGIICLFSLTVFNRLHVVKWPIFLVSAICFLYLPWLQIKFVAPSVILFFAYLYRLIALKRPAQYSASLVILLLTSYLMLAYYNSYAFNSIYGPYGQGALQLSKTSLMVFLGLHLDQNQGFFFQNPVYFFGLIGIGLLFRRNKSFFLLWLLIYSSLIVPNSLHPNWYGGWSFSGRFGWAGSILFMLPTIFGLASIYRLNRKYFYITFISASALQAYFYIKYVATSIDLYNKSNNLWLESYSLLYSPLERYLPALYNSDWAYSYTPNYTFFIFASLLVAVGFLHRFKCIIYVAAGSLFSFTMLNAFIEAPRASEITYQGSELPSLTGQTSNGVRFAIEGKDAPGFLTFGPYIRLKRGDYKVTMKYSSISSPNEEVAKMDIFASARNRIVAEYPLRGTNGETIETENIFTNHQLFSTPFEFRNYWTGKGNLAIHEIRISKIYY